MYTLHRPGRRKKAKAIGTTTSDVTEYTSQKFSHFQTFIHFMGTRLPPMVMPATTTKAKPSTGAIGTSAGPASVPDRCRLGAM